MTAPDRAPYEPPAGGSHQAQSIANQDREFLSAVHEGREPAVSGAAVRPAMTVLQAVQAQFDTWAPPGAIHSIG